MKTGKILAKLRDEANMSQKQLAKKMGSNASRVQRMETEAASFDDSDINKYLKAVATENAKDAQKYFKQDWTKLIKPDFFHPSRPSLWKAESALKENDKLKEGIAKDSVFYNQIELHDKTITELASYLESTEHTVACIGSIGVGKTTAICGFMDLINDNKPVLHTGGGRSTVCEVQIQQGPEFGITIDPLTDDEVYKLAYDFCDYLIAITSEKDGDKKSVDAESFTLNKEVERCLRNMADLPIKRKKTDEGFKQYDRARELVEKFRSTDSSDAAFGDDLKIEVIMRLGIENRKKTEVWYSLDIEDHPLTWLRKTYFDINHGRNPEFTIPRRITINISDPVLGYEKLKLRIIDTKGVDDTAKREDLETHLNDQRALTIFCSRFLDAPDETTKTLIERAIDSGINKKRLLNETAILVLSRNDEAISVNTLDGTPIEEREEGYMVRSDDIQSDLMKYDLMDLPVWFFDQKAEPAHETRNFILNRVEALRKFYETRVDEVASTINKVSDNIKDAKAEAAFDAVLKSIDAWIKDHKEIKLVGDIEEKLIEAIEDKGTYAASVRASVNRLGSWYNLDYYYQIGFGTRTEAVKSIAEMISELNAIVKNLQSREDLEPAHEFLTELLYHSNAETEKLYKEVQRYGQQIYKKKLYESDNLWDYLQDQWGRGPGYKLRISAKTGEWFKDKNQERLHALIADKIAETWNNMLEEFENLVQGVFAQ